MKLNKKTSQFLIIAAGTLLLAMIGYLFYQNQQLRQQLTPLQPPTAIPISDGTKNWKTYCKNIINNPKTKYKECEMSREYNSPDDKRMCEEIGGKYISCASQCRHDPPGTICVQDCVPLCIFQ